MTSLKIGSVPPVMESSQRILLMWVKYSDVLTDVPNDIICKGECTCQGLGKFYVSYCNFFVI